MATKKDSTSSELTPQRHIGQDRHASETGGGPGRRHAGRLAGGAHTRVGTVRSGFIFSGDEVAFFAEDSRLGPKVRTLIRREP